MGPKYLVSTELLGGCRYGWVSLRPRDTFPHSLPVVHQNLSAGKLLLKWQSPCTYSKIIKRQISLAVSILTNPLRTTNLLMIHSLASRQHNSYRYYFFKVSSIVWLNTFQYYKGGFSFFPYFLKDFPMVGN